MLSEQLSRLILLEIISCIEKVTTCIRVWNADRWKCVRFSLLSILLVDLLQFYINARQYILMPSIHKLCTPWDYIWIIQYIYKLHLLI